MTKYFLFLKIFSVPLEYQEFVEDSSSKGTIVVAFGHVISWVGAPEETIKTFFDAFEVLTDYRIVWQYTGKVLKTFSHVKIVKWLPQIDLLSHPKTKIFVSHCGAKSLVEAICSEVPVLAFPMFAEQMRNAEIIRSKGVGIKMNKFSMSKEYFLGRLNELLKNNQIYKKNAQKLSAQLHDYPKNPVEVGVFFVEFTLRNSNRMNFRQTKGAFLGYSVYFGLDFIFPLVFLFFFLQRSIIF